MTTLEHDRLRIRALLAQRGALTATQISVELDLRYGQVWRALAAHGWFVQTGLQGQAKVYGLSAEGKERVA